MHKHDIQWPPAFTIRRSARARRIRLRIRPLAGLEIVLPEQADEAEALTALERHRLWVTRHLADAPAGTPELPERMDLHGGIRPVRIEWTRSDLAATRPGRLAESRAPGLPPACRLKDGPDGKRRAALKTWLAEYARLYLGERLAAISARHSFTLPRLRVGWQKTRWGSYSAKGVVSLNARLVFMPEHLSDAVILHELCHSRHMNHGPDFKSLLASLNPRIREDDRELNRASRLLPAWIALLQ